MNTFVGMCFFMTDPILNNYDQVGNNQRKCDCFFAKTLIDQRAHLSACPRSGHQLNHGGVVRRVARVRNNELGLVLHEVGDLAGNCKQQQQ